MNKIRKSLKTGGYLWQESMAMNACKWMFGTAFFLKIIYQLDSIFSGGNPFYHGLMQLFVPVEFCVSDIFQKG